MNLTSGKDVPAAAEIREIACHKKNPDLGTKHIYYDREIFIEQEDAATFTLNEEVILSPNRIDARSL